VRDLKGHPRTRGIPIVVLTTPDQPTERARAQHEGCATVRQYWSSRACQNSWRARSERSWPRTSLRRTYQPPEFQRTRPRARPRREWWAAGHSQDACTPGGDTTCSAARMGEFSSTCAILNSVPSHRFTTLHHMAIPQAAVHVTCPACHWTKAVLAYKTKAARCFLCPNCQHVWDIPVIRKAAAKP
jgi:hypothetical protein